MNLDLKGKNALVCGGSKGLGFASAIELAKLGAKVVLLSRSEDRLRKAVEQLDKINGLQNDFLSLDLSNEKDLISKINMLLNEMPIHILINNTGGPSGGLLLDAEGEEFLKAMHMHLIASHHLTKLISPVMKKENYGRIINIISTSVRQPIGGLGVSNTTRGAMASWSKTLSNELAAHGITVNNVLPGTTKTERIEELIGSWQKSWEMTEDEVRRTLIDQIPMGRFGEAEELGATVAFLASPAAAYITGVNLPVDGGCLLYTSPSPRDRTRSRMPSSA